MAKPKRKKISPKASTLIIFTRFPKAGRAKTRLHPLLGSMRAAHLQRLMTKRLQVQARVSCFHNVVTIYADPPHHQSHLPRQPSVGFERRMLACMNRYHKVILIGADLPLVSHHDLNLLQRSLGKNRFVIAPSGDGGYWAIGRRQKKDIFLLHHALLSSHQAQDVYAKLSGSIFWGPMQSDCDDGQDYQLFNLSSGLCLNARLTLA